VFDHLRNNNIGVNVHYIPVYMQPYYQKLGFKKGYCPMAESYYDRVISLPMYSALKESEIEYVIMKLREGLKN
jgi:dTDP-4-amino-4,6-dideoxygalactose transaminase